MIPVAVNLQEAINHFLYSDGLISCKRRGGEKVMVCKSLKEAQNFFSRKKLRNKVRPIK